MPSLILVSLIWSISFGLIGNCLSSLPSDFVAFVRMGLALLVFLPFLRRAPAGKTALLTATGAVQFGLMYLAYTAAFSCLPSHQVALFTVLTPLYVILLHDLVERRCRLLPVLCVLLAVAGCAGILWKTPGGGQATLWRGFLLVQLSNLCFACGQIAYSRLSPAGKTTAPDYSVFAWLYLGAFVTVLPGGLTHFSCWREVTGVQWLVLLYLGVVASGVCFFLWNHGARQVPAVRLAVMNNLKIPLAALASLCLFGEKAHWQTLGPGLLLMGLALFFSNRAKEKNSGQTGRT